MLAGVGNALGASARQRRSGFFGAFFACAKLIHDSFVERRFRREALETGLGLGNVTRQFHFFSGQTLAFLTTHTP
jgi:hypothetical protein